MKTLNKKNLSDKKQELKAEFDKWKKKALHYEGVSGAALKQRNECLKKMNELQGAFKAIVDLESTLGIKPEKSTLEDNAHPGKKK